MWDNALKEEAERLQAIADKICRRYTNTAIRVNCGNRNFCIELRVEQIQSQIVYTVLLDKLANEQFAGLLTSICEDMTHVESMGMSEMLESVGHVNAYLELFIAWRIKNYGREGFSRNLEWHPMGGCISKKTKKLNTFVKILVKI